MSIRPVYTALQGGLDLVSPPTLTKPGRLLGAVNYEAPITGGYRSIDGYTAYAAIPSTEGPVLGVVVFKGVQYCVRKSNSTAYGVLHKLIDSVWTPVTGNLPNAAFQFAIGNFQSLSYTETLFLQAKDSGKVWKYDGSTLSEIAGSPSGGRWLAVHYSHLFVGFANGSLQHSVLGNPTDWTTGAGEIGVSSGITGITSTLGVLMVGCTDSIKILAGDSVDNWVLKTHSPNTGCKAYSLANMTQPFFAYERGLTSLQATQDYGDFALGQWGADIVPLFEGTGLTPVAAIACREKAQYRVFFDNKTGVYGTLIGGGKVACTTISFPDQIACAWSGESTTGEEMMLIGDSTGTVYRLDSGTTLGGDAIESYMAVAFNHYNGPTVEKRFLRLYLEVLSDSGASSLTVLPMFDYGKEEIARHRVNVIDVLGAGGFWGISDWSDFRWGSPIQDDREVFVSAIARNMGFTIYHSSSTDAPHTVTGYTTHFEPKRLRRG